MVIFNMALVKTGDKALDISAKDIQKPETTKKQDVLDEDSYIQSIENIIERDFFPEVTKLKAQNQYIEAVDAQDVGKLRLLSSQYRVVETPVGTPAPSPASFERPSTQKQWEGPDEEDTFSTPRREGVSTKPETGEDVQESQKNISLDKFLAKHTSEDNASFETIMESSIQKNKDKYAWLYEKENEHRLLSQQRLALPEGKDGDSLKLADRPANVDNWDYTNKNTLMYIPECVTLTTEEQISRDKLQEREIKHGNTRLPDDMFCSSAMAESMGKVIETQVIINKGKIGVDGKEIGGSETPNVNGFQFVGTPSPAPGVDASPFMTWGTIEGTPFRLDAGNISVDSTPGPTFKIPEPKKREVLALKLAEKASKRHREERRQAQAASVIGRSPKHKNTSEKLLHMSPAAQRLASERLGIRVGTDKALRSSYSPSPQRVSERTPRRSALTPSSRTGYTPEKSQTPRTPSLTDNLLNLPKQ